MEYVLAIVGVLVLAVIGSWNSDRIERKFRKDLDDLVGKDPTSRR